MKNHNRPKTKGAAAVACSDLLGSSVMSLDTWIKWHDKQQHENRHCQNCGAVITAALGGNIIKPAEQTLKLPPIGKPLDSYGAGLGIINTVARKTTLYKQLRRAVHRIFMLVVCHKRSMLPNESSSPAAAPNAAVSGQTKKETDAK